MLQATDAPSLDQLQRVADSVVTAIRRGDPRVLANLVDERGITLGTDFPKISAAAFRAQLRSRSGIYCDLLGCPSVKESLRADLRDRTTCVRAVRSSDFPGTGQADVLDTTGAPAATATQASPLFTLFFVWRHRRWRLQQIEYT